MPLFTPRLALIEAHELTTGEQLLVSTKDDVLTVLGKLPPVLFDFLFAPAENGKKAPARAAGGGRRAAGGGRAKLVKTPRAAKPGKPSEADYAQAVARCLKGEKVSAVVKDFRGMVYATLYGRVVAAREQKAPAETPASPPAAAGPGKKVWV